ncbi:hypothetical protein [Candidatus Nitronereus thalassa]|uniref:Uncharacterized protein n=1 Tax=Candidatus Nitronereus thalassa TaxID=3020898 RepID=A0ABU3K371_9BACT|nr:hypothetical protein [Candidatus Nitronereus thalassa]MDT7040835.1 hypothetical protein [Candidatus Nitronereus thalassa]
MSGQTAKDAKAARELLSGNGRECRVPIVRHHGVTCSRCGMLAILHDEWEDEEWTDES